MVCSYLKTLLDPFNEMVNRFLDQIKPLADGEEAVPMKHHFGELTLNIISKVSYLHNVFSVCYIIDVRDLFSGWEAQGFPTPEVDFPSLKFL